MEKGEVCFMVQLKFTSIDFEMKVKLGEMGFTVLTITIDLTVEKVVDVRKIICQVLVRPVT